MKSSVETTQKASKMSGIPTAPYKRDNFSQAMNSILVLSLLNLGGFLPLPATAASEGLAPDPGALPFKWLDPPNSTTKKIRIRLPKTKGVNFRTEKKKNIREETRIGGNKHDIVSPFPHGSSIPNQLIFYCGTVVIRK